MRREMIKGRQGSWGQGGSGNREPHLRGVYIQWKQVFLGYAAWIFIMPLYSSLLNFNHFTHIRQTTSWCQKSVRAAGSPVARQNSKGGSFTGRRRTRERHQTNSKLPFSQIQHLFVTFHFKTHTFPDRIKAQLKHSMFLHVDCKSYFRVWTHLSTGEGELFPQRKMIDF